ncbi:MAG TPA: hypothetical protein VJ579_02985 [Candidatus Paceibacterota bacterium]|nr:hypothetical protein [Candidatus Paceibacterota bacterium]
MGNTTGKRIARSHTTAIALASELALMLDASGVVTKVMLGVITARSGCKTEKIIINHDQFNLRLTIQQPPTKQELYVSAPDRISVAALIVTWSKQKNIECIVRTNE